MTSTPTAYTVYTKSECPNCVKTKAYFEAKGITYTAVDAAALEYITVELAYAQVPVVVNNADEQDHWAGLRRDKLVTAAMNHTREEAMA